MGRNISSSRGLDYEWVVLLIKFIVIILFRKIDVYFMLSC